MGASAASRRDGDRRASADELGQLTTLGLETRAQCALPCRRRPGRWPSPARPPAIQRLARARRVGGAARAQPAPWQRRRRQRRTGALDLGLALPRPRLRPPRPHPRALCAARAASICCWASRDAWSSAGLPRFESLPHHCRGRRRVRASRLRCVVCRPEGGVRDCRTARAPREVPGWRELTRRPARSTVRSAAAASASS